MITSVLNRLKSVRLGLPIKRVSFGKYFIFNRNSSVEFKGKTNFGHNCFVTALGGKIIFGENFKCNNGVHINADIGGLITFGSNVLVGPNVIIRSANHRFRNLNRIVSNQGHDVKDIKIGNNVWIGGGVIVLPGVEIGDNSVIGAGAVVTKSIKANSIAVGNPAKEIDSIL